MAAFDENIVREYFELNGFLVRQLRKYKVQSRKKRADEEIDLLVYNPAPEEVSASRGFQLFSGDVRSIHRALVVVKGWHTSSFTPRMLKQSNKIFDFLKKDVLDAVEKYFSEDDELIEKVDAVTKVLVLPGLPATEPHRQESIELLKENGIDFIVTFRTILENLLQGIEANNSYQKSESLHLLRLLKIYDMIRAPQMELFTDERKRR
ncbi:MAG: hypothetical protein AAGJ81_04550 [Verrucomicrobiota bacterium]